MRKMGASEMAQWRKQAKQAPGREYRSQVRMQKLGIVLMPTADAGKQLHSRAWGLTASQSSLNGEEPLVLRETLS